DGANSTPDLVSTTLTVGGTATANTTGVDMVAHSEYLACIQVTSVAAGCTLVVKAQESNEAAANFTDVTGAAITYAANTVNDAQWVDVDWRHPDRLRYARLTATVTGANAAVLSANTLRVH
ncbi:unnamed protein product, partial [marine sediment metagenome]